MWRRSNRHGIWCKLFSTKCLAHDGGVIGTTIGIRRLVNPWIRLVDVAYPFCGFDGSGDTTLGPAVGDTILSSWVGDAISN